MKFFLSIILPLLLLSDARASTSQIGPPKPLSACSKLFATPEKKHTFLGGHFPVESTFFFTQFLQGKTAAQVIQEQEPQIKEMSDYFEARIPQIKPLRVKTVQSRSYFILKEVLQGYNPDTDLIIGVDANAWHANLIAGGARFDGNFAFGNSWDSRDRVRAQDLGITLWFQGLPQEQIALLKASILKNERISDLNCWSALIQLIETKSSLKLNRKNPGLPLLPQEILLLLLEGRLTDPAGNKYFPVTINTGKVPFSTYLNQLVESTNRGISIELPKWLLHQESRSRLMSIFDAQFVDYLIDRATPRD